MHDEETTAGSTEAEIVSRLARRASEPHPADPVRPHTILVGEGESLETLDLERFLPTPRRPTGIYRPADTASFIDYATVHRDPDQTTVWVNQIEASIVAVLNDHSKENNGWADHRAHLQLLRTTEWQHWLAHDGDYLTQEEFAEHLQDGIVEILEPDSAEMLEIAQTIQGKTKADWKSASRLDNGALGFVYQEEVEAAGGRAGNLEIPSEMRLGVAPFYGEQPSEVIARIRYRIREGNLKIGYRLERPNEVELLVLRQIAGRLRDEAGFDRVYMGVAPA